MRVWLSHLRRLVIEAKGASAVEYGLIVGLVVLAMLVGFQAVGSTTIEMWNNVSTQVEIAR